MIAWESDEVEDQVGQAVNLIREAVDRIEQHYHDVTHWPGWNSDAYKAMQLSSRLLLMALTSEVRADA